MTDSNEVKLVNFINKIKADRWNQFLFTLIFSGVVGLIAFALQLASNQGRLTNFVFFFSLSFFVVYVFIAGHVRTINSSLPNAFYKKIISFDFMLRWGLLFFSWLIIGSVVIGYLHFSLIIEPWFYFLIFLIVGYPCLGSLIIYIQSYKYLRNENNDVEKKITFVKALTIITIGIATPWLLALFFILVFIPTPIWVEFILILTVYLAIFFLAIDLPYHQSMEAVKGRMVKDLEKTRQSLVDRLSINCKSSERIALELNIQRVDRDIDTIRAKSSHPFSIIKPIAGFIGVSIGASVVAGIIVELLKLGLNIG